MAASPLAPKLLQRLTSFKTPGKGECRHAGAQEFDVAGERRQAGRRRNKGTPVDHISLSDPVTWAGILVAAFLIAGLRWLIHGGGRRKPPQG